MEVRLNPTNIILAECICMETREQLVSTLESPHKHLGGGQRKEKSSREETLQDTTCIFLEAKKVQTLEKELSTLECPLGNSQETSKDKSSFYLSNIPNIELSETWDQELISKDADYYPFWDPSLTEEYQKLWLPQKTDYVDLPLSSSNGFANGMKQKSWFSIRSIKDQNMSLQKTYLPPYKYSVVDGMEKGATGNLIARKVKILPTTKQKLLLKQFAGTCRFLYNQAISMIMEKKVPYDSQEIWDAMVQERAAKFKAEQRRLYKEEGLKLLVAYKHQKTLPRRNMKKFQAAWVQKLAMFKEKYSKEYEEKQQPWLNNYAMRDFLVSNESKNVQEHPWMVSVPNATRQYAVKEALANIQACKTNKKRGHIRRFRSPFRRKKSKHWSLLVAKNALRGDVLFPKRNFKALHFTERDCLQPVYDHAMQISRDDNLSHYFTFLKEVSTDEAAPENQGGAIFSVDPGVRIRHCIYDTRGFVHCVGENDITRIIRLSKRLDMFISKRSLSKGLLHSTRRRLWKQQRKLSNKIRHLKDEIDNKTIRFMVSNAHTILLPSFDTHNMVNKRTRNIRSKTARAMMSWRHGEFKSKLLDRGTRAGVKVVIVSEHYTSKTCGHCGHIHPSLGGSKTFECPSCGYTIHRDYNGARNILLRALRRFPHGGNRRRGDLQMQTSADGR
jgi:putative transposase